MKTGLIHNPRDRDLARLAVDMHIHLMGRLVPNPSVQSVLNLTAGTEFGCPVALQSATNEQKNTDFVLVLMEAYGLRADSSKPEY